MYCQKEKYNEGIIGLITSLLVDDDAKETLKTVHKIANSQNKRIRDSVPSLFVVAEQGSGLSTYGKTYSRILEDSPLLQTHGLCTFLELTFPKNDLREEKLFFSSPQRIATTTNRFYGTMLISLEEYSGLDLMKCSSFKALLEFVERNKKNIHFVFRVTPDFSAKKQLTTKLMEYINIVEVDLLRPNLETGYKYIIRALNEWGYSIDKTAQKYLRERLLAEIISGKEYQGYRSLNSLIDKIVYDVAVFNTDEDMVVTHDILCKISWGHEERINVSEVSRIGFQI